MEMDKRAHLNPQKEEENEVYWCEGFHIAKTEEVSLIRKDQKLIRKKDINQLKKYSKEK